MIAPSTAEIDRRLETIRNDLKRLNLTLNPYTTLPADDKDLSAQPDIIGNHRKKVNYAISLENYPTVNGRRTKVTS